MLSSLASLVTESGFAAVFLMADGWKNLVMIAIACVLLYLGIKKQYEPLLMVGIATGCLLANVSATPCIIRNCGMLSWTAPARITTATVTSWPTAA